MSFFKQASKESGYLRVVMHGSPGAGKTWSALKLAHYLQTLYEYPENSIALADTERGSASKYAGESFDDEGNKFNFLTVGDEFFGGDYSIAKFNKMMSEVEKSKIPILIIDSMSMFWNGTNGITEFVDEQAAKMKGGNSFVAWKAGDKLYKQMVQSLTAHKGHIICTLRSKLAYEQKTNENGRKEIQRLGMAPEMRDHFISELDVECYLDEEHNLTIGKTRCNAVDGKMFKKPGKDFAKALFEWSSSGVKGRDVFAEIMKESEAIKTVEDLADFAGKIKNNKILLTDSEVDVLRDKYNTLMKSLVVETTVK